MTRKKDKKDTKPEMLHQRMPAPRISSESAAKQQRALPWWPRWDFPTSLANVESNSSQVIFTQSEYLMMLPFVV